MWCDHCQLDITISPPSDGQPALCPECATPLSNAPAAVIPPSVGGSNAKRPLADPHELLARWAREDALGSLDSIGPSPGRLPSTSSEGKSQMRVDASHPVLPPQNQVLDRTPRQPAAPTAAPRAPTMPQSDLVIHPPHAFSPPHFIAVPTAPRTDRGSKWVTLVGQLFAYLGVGGLTVGTALVLIGYFGGPGHYATTGWLVTTAGQMLLFLGVITLISGGMEQTTQEVARRIESLGERLVRIEQATQQPPASARSENSASRT
ncbi:MAG: hypothetical protein ACKV0T_20900 [Planctomycetales bacterium]